MEINRLIESDTLELKRELPTSEKLAIEMIALANAKGGRIIIGFDEEHKTIIGCQVDQRQEELIANIATDLVTPKLDYHISYETIEEKELLIINVLKSSLKPHYLANRGMENGTYMRIGSTSRRVDRETLARLIREGKNITFDSEPTSKKIEIEASLVTEFLERRRLRLNSPKVSILEKEYENLGVTNDKKTTIAGALLFSKNPESLPELSGAYIKAGRFKGEEKGLFIDQRNITGPLPQQIDEAVGFILRNTEVKGKVVGLKREDSIPYPVEILRELITNAVIHRDYSISGACTFLEVFDKHIVVKSPGGLPGLVTVENIQDYQYSRNPIVAKRMFEMGFFDSWGQGIDKIILWAKDQGLKCPVFSDSGGQFSVEIFNIPSTSKSMSNRSLKIAEDALNIAKKQGYLQNEQLREQLGLSKMQAQVLLNQLLDSGKLEREGKGRGTKYTLKV